MGGPGGNGIIQELSAVDAITFRRWKLSLIEQLSYLPPSGVGIYGLGGDTGGIAPPPLNPGLVPGQTILTAAGQSLSSTSDAEADVQLTGRSSLTFVGGYSFLGYFTDSTLNYGGLNARAGYNYQWTRKNTLAVVYTFNRYNYSNYNQSIDSQSFQLSFARRVTGRLAFQASAGPQFASFLQPIPTGSTSPPSSWNAALLDCERSIAVFTQAGRIVSLLLSRYERRIGCARRVAVGRGKCLGVAADKSNT